MPDYYAKVQSTLSYSRPDLLDRWLKKHAGEWVRVRIEELSHVEDPKTREQLGYYWGLLLPEIHQQLISDGHTETVYFGEIQREIPITKTKAHELISEVCGYIGDNGEHQRLSECDKFDGIRWLDNVLNLAGELCMDVDKLKAKGPYKEAEK